MSRHSTRLNLSQGREDHKATAQRSSKERLLSQDSAWPPLRDNYFRGSGVKIIALDDAQLEPGSLEKSTSEKSGSYLHETSPVLRHWSGSSSESVTSSHSFLSSLPEDSSVDDHFLRYRRSINLDQLLVDIHKKADNLSAIFSRLGLQEGGHRTTAYAGGTTRHSGEGQSGQTPSRRHSYVPQGNRRHNPRRRVNRQHTDDEDSSEIEDRRSGNSPQGIGAVVVYLACPYVKNDPDSYIRCNFRELKSISILKQHLKREHKLGDIYCTNCLEHFKDDKDLEAHREATCEKRVTDQHHSICEQIRKRRKGQIEEIWYSIYRIIFPDTVDPASPYAGDESRKHLMFLFETLGQEHTRHLMNNLSIKSRRRHTIASTTAFERRSLKLITALADEFCGPSEPSNGVTIDNQLNQHHLPVSATQKTTTFDNADDAYNPIAYSDVFLPPQTIPPISTATTVPTPRPTSNTSNTNNNVSIREDEDATVGSLSQRVPESVRDMLGSLSQRRMNEHLYPNYRHSHPDRRAEPWAIPESRPVTNPEGMERVDVRQMLENEGHQENAVFADMNPDGALWDLDIQQLPTPHSRITRGQSSTRRQAPHYYQNPSSYWPFE